MIRRRVPRFSIPAGISYWPPTVPDAAPGVMSSTAAVIVDWTNGWLFPAAAGADQSVWGMSAAHSVNSISQANVVAVPADDAVTSSANFVETGMLISNPGVNHSPYD